MLFCIRQLTCSFFRHFDQHVTLLYVQFRANKHLQTEQKWQKKTEKKMWYFVAGHEFMPLPHKYSAQVIIRWTYIYFHLCCRSVLLRYSVVRNTWPCNSPSLNILFSTDNHCGSFCYTYIDTWRFHRMKKYSVLWTQLNLFFIFSTFFFCSELFLGLVKI